jgi:P pilus assembly chaperone PapD
MVVGAALAVVVVAVRWDAERGRTVRMLQTDLQMAQARERCWEALARYIPRSADDVIPAARRDAWVARCLATELGRVNARR